MSNNKDDLRYIKTEYAIFNAMASLLVMKNFRKITVDMICQKGLISRATFYAHFIDKYELLKYCLITLRKGIIDKFDSFDKIERLVNEFVRENGNILKNLINEADKDTLMILSDFMRSSLKLIAMKDDSGKANAQYVVLSEFYTGGMLYYLSWQVNNKFPPEIPMMNMSLYKLMEKFWEWEADNTGYGRLTVHE